MKTLEQTPTVSEYDIPIGPMIEETRLSSGQDYYKPTMSQIAHEVEPEAEVTFTFHNRGNQRLADYVNPDTLQAEFDRLQKEGFADAELAYFASLKLNDGSSVFDGDFLNYLANHELPKVVVGRDESDDIAIETTGPWAMVTFWETMVMSKVNEAYFEGYLIANNIDPYEVYNEGDRRLSEKIAILQANPDIKFADYGTRRSFSLRWHAHVIDRLTNECPANYLGTSNVELSDEHNTTPIGTFAHEMPMVFAGLADARGQDIRASHNQFLQKWYDKYGQDYSIALTDTFGTGFFFEDFTNEQAVTWRGLRQDSGNPIEFGEHAIKFYEEAGVDPTTKTIVFSDGLDIDQILKLHEYFAGRVKVLFGWGTTLTNDLGIKPLNFVMKATHVRDLITGEEADTVKLSDDNGKHTGPEDLIKSYQNEDFKVRG